MSNLVNAHKHCAKINLSRLIVMIAAGCFLTSCSYQHIHYGLDTRQTRYPLIIAMPRNPVVIEYVHDILYTALWDYFGSVGYNLASDNRLVFRSCTLETVIRNLDNVDTLISPDVQPYGHKVIALIQWKLSDWNGNILGQGQEVGHGWVYKPCDPIFNRDYMMFQYRQLLRQIPPRIDHHVRKLLDEEYKKNK